MQKIRLCNLMLCLIGVVAVAPQRGLAAEPTPQEVLKSKGLSPVGQKFLLDADVGLAEWLRQVRAAEKKVDDAAKRRANLERDIRGLEVSSDKMFEQWKEEKEKLSKISKNADVTYNKQVKKVNGLRAAILDSLDQIKKRQATIASIGDPSDEYVSLMIKFGAAIDSTMEKYKTLPDDPQVKAAIDKINQVGTLKVTLGPSDRLNTELPNIRKLRDKVNSDVINLEIRSNVATVPITLNGAVITYAIVDSGASYISISEKLAKQLDLKPEAKDRTIHVVTADGSINEVHLMVLKSVRLGKFTVENVECVVVPDNGKQVDTLLGGTFLKRFVYRMDLSAGQLRLTQLADAAAAAEPAKPPTPASRGPVQPPQADLAPIDAKIKSLDNWTKQGEWKIHRGQFTGLDKSRLEFPTSIPPNCTVSFKFNILGDAQSGIGFDGIGLKFLDEKRSHNFNVVGVKAEGKPFGYQNQHNYSIAFHFHGDRFEIDIDGKQRFTGTCKPEQDRLLYLIGGAERGEGAAFWDFAVSPNTPAAGK